jgi:CRP-like cAMP-binding protein
MKVDGNGHEEEVRRLREFAAFEKFSDSELKRLVQAAHHTSTSVPLPLIHEQTPSDACYILLRGEVGVYVGQDRVAVLGPGEVIGESVLRRGKLRSATVTTTGPAEVLRIERDDLARLVDEIPALRETMDATVARHVPVALPERPAKPKPTHRRVDALVPTDLAERFEHVADSAGVRVSAALEDALTQWIQRNSTADPTGIA